MQEKQLSEKDSLHLINQMMHEAKNYYYETGLGGLLSGFGVLVCSILTYLMEKDLISFPFQPFYIMVLIFLVQAFLYNKEEKRKKAKTVTDSVIDFLWLGFYLAVIASLCGLFAGFH